VADLLNTATKRLVTHRPKSLEWGAFEGFAVGQILQHSSEADGYLLAHEMSVAAVIRGEENGRWLAAASEDRFLMKIGRKQRFGTQYEPSDVAGKFRLAATDPGVTDQLREILNAPSLAEAKATASRFDKK
jgi:hypothetical protein